MARKVISDTDLIVRKVLIGTPMANSITVGLDSDKTRALFGATGDLTYNQNTGVFGVIVGDQYTKADFDSDISTLHLGGTGLGWHDSSQTLYIDSAELGAYYAPVIRSLFSVDSDMTYDPSTGKFSIDIPQTYLTANFDSDLNTALNDNRINTSHIVEDSSNLFYLPSRVDSDINNQFDLIQIQNDSGDGSLAYTANTKTFSFTGVTAAETRAHFGATNISGDGSIAYIESDGTYTYTGPSDSDYRAAFTTADGVELNTGEISLGDITPDTVVTDTVTTTLGYVEHTPMAVATVTTDATTLLEQTSHNSEYTGIEYLCFLYDSDNVRSQTSKMLLSFDTTRVSMVEYGGAYTSDSDIGTFSTLADGTNINLYFTRNNPNNVAIKISKTVIK